MDRMPQAGDFLNNIRKPEIQVPDPRLDFGMYQRLETAFIGIAEELDQLRRNQGRIGYAGQNLMSDLSKAAIEASMRGDDEDVAFLENDMAKLAEGFESASIYGELAETGNRFSRTIWQEKLEANLFRITWPVVTGRSDNIPEIPSWKDFQGNIQAYLYAFLDSVSELGKAVGDELASPNITTDEEFRVINRYLPIADSIVLQLSRHRHVPGYVINNAFGHWAAYSTKLRTAYGTIAHIRRDYSLRMSNRRMHEETRRVMLELVEAVGARELLKELKL